jgi:hypothetical protein
VGWRRADAIAPMLEGGQGYPLLTDAGAVFAVQIVLTFTERVELDRRRIVIDGAKMLEDTFRATSVSTSFNVDTTDRSQRLVCENPSTQGVKLHCITVRLPSGASV